MLLLACYLLDFATSAENPYGVKIFTIGDGVLRENCKLLSVEEIVNDPRIQEAKDCAFLALSNFRALTGFGRAIAAPQVGYPIQMIATNFHGKREFLFNPVIKEASRETFNMWDDCLSLPNMMVCVRRHKRITVSFLDENGQPCTWENCEQALSELLQHEIDHLKGILAVDRADYTLPIAKKQSPIVTREEWLARRAYFDSLVDFAY